MHALGAFINSGFKMILPLAVQLPQRVGICRIDRLNSKFSSPLRWMK